MNGDNVTYFDSLGVEHIPNEIKKIMENKNITTSIYRIEANDSTLCVYFWIGCIDFILKGKSLLDYDDLFSPMNMKRTIKQN